MSVNKVILLGHLGSDVELRYTDQGQAVCNFSLATSEKWTGKDGKPKESTEWHRIVAWKRLAEVCGEYLSKGKQVYIEGKLQTRSWEKDGQKMYTTEIVAQKVDFVGGKGQSEKSTDKAMENYPEPVEDTEADDDLPF